MRREIKKNGSGRGIGTEKELKGFVISRGLVLYIYIRRRRLNANARIFYLFTF